MRGRSTTSIVDLGTRLDVEDDPGRPILTLSVATPYSFE
jgi:hypothetical protein